MTCLRSDRYLEVEAAQGLCLKPLRDGGTNWGHACPHLLRCLGWCPARGTASWQQGSAGSQQGWKDYKREAASTGWRWQWAPGHVPTCMAGPPYLVLPCNKPNIPSVQGFELYSASSLGKLAYTEPCTSLAVCLQIRCAQSLHPRMEPGSNC